MNDRGMYPQSKMAPLFLWMFFCAVKPGLANESAAALSNQDLAAAVTGASITIALPDGLQNNQARTYGNMIGRRQNFSGIETSSANIGQNSTSQAETSLTVRATLTMSERRGLGF
ncbi:MAG: hypothetical protein V4527_12905 [Pseudomonadota bacterium]